MVINETIQTALEISKATAYTPSLVTFWVSSVVILFFVGLIFKIASHKRGWGNFWAIWFFYSLISGIVLVFLLVAPTFISDTITKLKTFFA
jgi:hypothetical protein